MDRNRHLLLLAFIVFVTSVWMVLKTNTLITTDIPEQYSAEVLVIMTLVCLSYFGVHLQKCEQHYLKVALTIMFLLLCLFSVAATARVMINKVDKGTYNMISSVMTNICYWLLWNLSRG